MTEAQEFQWTKEALQRRAAEAWEEAALTPERVFLFRFLQFQFTYDDTRRECRIECPVTPVLYNPLRMVHGGIYTYIADTAIGHLIFGIRRPRMLRWN